jgi:hypothetical protein
LGIRARAIFILLLVLLSGCIGGPLPLRLPNYALGPVTSDQFPNLVFDAIASEENEVQVFGPATILLLDNRYWFKTVAVVTDKQFQFLNWNKAEGRYEIVGQIPFSEILAYSTLTYGKASPVYLYVNENKMSLGDRIFAIREPLHFEFIKGILVDKEKNEVVLTLLKDQIEFRQYHQQVDDDMGHQ